MNATAPLNSASRRRRSLSSRKVGVAPLDPDASKARVHFIGRPPDDLRWTFPALPDRWS